MLNLLWRGLAKLTGNVRNGVSPLQPLVFRFMPTLGEVADELHLSDATCRHSSYRAVGCWQLEHGSAAHASALGFGTTDAEQIIVGDQPEDYRALIDFCYRSHEVTADWLGKHSPFGRATSGAPYHRKAAPRSIRQFNAVVTKSRIDYGHNRGVGSPAHLLMGYFDKSSVGLSGPSDVLGIAFQGNRSQPVAPLFLVLIPPGASTTQDLSLISGDAVLEIRATDRSASCFKRSSEVQFRLGSRQQLPLQSLFDSAPASAEAVVARIAHNL